MLDGWIFFAKEIPLMHMNVVHLVILHCSRVVVSFLRLIGIVLVSIKGQPQMIEVNGQS